MPRDSTLKRTIIACLFLYPPHQLFAAPGEWVAFGDIRGHIESCGCSPATDYGGVQRIANLVAKIQEQRPEVMVFDLGNSLSPTDDIKTSQNKMTLVRGLHQVTQTKAVLADPLSLKARAKKDPLKPYVLSNTKSAKKSADHPPAPFILHQKTLIFGFLSPKLASFSTPVDQRFAGLVTHTKNKHPESNQAILLFRGTSQELKTLLKLNIFDQIIRGNPSPSEQPMDGTEVHSPLQLQFSPSVWSVPLAGTGILFSNFGLAQKFIPINLSAISKPKKTIPPKAVPFEFSPQAQNPLTNLSPPKVPIVWLDKKHQLGDALKQEYQNYQHLALEQTNHLLKKPSGNPLGFVGSFVCQSCHPNAFKTWKSSAHASALPTLQKNKKDKNYECLSCHTVGLGKKDGFKNPQATPELAGVGCESCHGPRKHHLASPTQKQQSPIQEAKKSCTGCHKPPHVANFNYQHKWPLISHGKS